jgi:hypothetical protein
MKNIQCGYFEKEAISGIANMWGTFENEGKDLMIIILS